MKQYNNAEYSGPDDDVYIIQPDSMNSQNRKMIFRQKEIKRLVEFFHSQVIFIRSLIWWMILINFRLKLGQQANIHIKNIIIPTIKKNLSKNY